MRYVKVRLAPNDGGSFHPLGQQIADKPEVTRVSIHRIELLEDGSAIMLAEARGNKAEYEELLSDSPFVYEFTITDAGGQWYAYTHFEPTELTSRMLQLRRESVMMVEMPIHVAEDGSLEFKFVGDSEGFASSTPPESDEYKMELLEIGEHHAEMDDLFSCLTERQREVLDCAVRCGYYQNPREATHKEIAAAVDLSPSTIGEHLRKIESRVFSEFVRDGQEQ